MKIVRSWGFTGLLLGTAVACGGPQRPANETPSEPSLEEEFAEAPEPEPEESAPAEEESEATSSEQAKVEPQFEPGMSVNQAMDAVPRGMDRLNVEQEALAAPLMNAELYEPCKLKGHEHFSVTVAIWDGRAVGLDIETSPKNEELASCLRRQIESIEWEDKVPSLNTVQYSY